jgi:hypothetical protein
LDRQAEIGVCRATIREMARIAKTIFDEGRKAFGFEIERENWKL